MLAGWRVWHPYDPDALLTEIDEDVLLVGSPGHISFTNADFLRLKKTALALSVRIKPVS